MTPSELTTILPELFAMKRSPFIWGKTGIGKSSVVHQTAASLGLELRDVRMSQLDSIDMRGFPMPDAKTKTMTWLSPDFLPTEKDKPGVLFLDELNSAEPAVLAPCYQLILDRRIGAYKFPDHWHIVAAGNNMTDRGITHQMPAPLNNRFLHIDYQMSADDSQAYAAKCGLSIVFRAYLKMKPASWHIFDPVQNPRAFPTPRSWHAANEIWVNPKFSPVKKLELLQGTVGEGAAAEVVGFARDLAAMPDIDAVLLNPEKAKLPGTQPVMHAVVTALEDRSIDSAKFERIMIYVKRLPKEIQAVYIRAATIKLETAATNTKSYLDWALENQHIVS